MRYPVPGVVTAVLARLNRSPRGEVVAVAKVIRKTTPSRYDRPVKFSNPPLRRASHTLDRPHDRASNM